MTSAGLRRVPVAVFFALLWAALAVARPATTFHLAPLIVALWPGLGQPDPTRAVASSGIGLVLAVATTVLLSLSGMLQGPSLLPWGGPALESVAAAAVGAVLAVAVSVLRPGRDRA